MKPKINVSDELAKLCEKFKEDSDFLAVYKNGNQVEIALMGDDDDLPEMFSRMIEGYLNNTDAEGIQKVANIIITAVEKVLSKHGLASLWLTLRLTEAIVKSVSKTPKPSKKKAKEKDEEDDDDCEHCEFLKECTLQEAVATRKRLGIPRPKKARKNNE